VASPKEALRNSPCFSSYQHFVRYTVTSNLIELLPFNLSDNHMIETG
jgi:hypothetical protein